MKRVFIKAAAAVVVILAVVGCGASASATQPKPPGWSHIDLPEDVSTYDVSSFCDHGNRVYLVDHGYHGISAVADPSCAR